MYYINGCLKIINDTTNLGTNLPQNSQESEGHNTNNDTQLAFK